MIAADVPPALVASAPVPAFRPPLDQPVRYRLTDSQRASGGMKRFVTRLEARFTPGEGSAFTLTLTLRPERAHAAALFSSMMDAFASVPLRYRLDGAGQPVDVIGADESWAAAATAIADGVARATRGLPANAPRARALLGFRDGFAATPPAARRAALLANAEQVTGLPAEDLARGGTWTGEATDTGGRPIAMAGTLTPVPCEPTLLCVRIEATSGGPNAPAAGIVREDVEVAVSRADGLLVRSRRSLRMGNEASPFFIEEVAREL